MPKSFVTEKLTNVGTSGTTFQASTGETRYVVQVAASSEVIIDIGDATNWVEAYRVAGAALFFPNPVVVHGSNARLRFRAVSGTVTAVFVTYISQT